MEWETSRLRLGMCCGEWMNVHSVLVIGSGLAGLAAAFSARKCGADVHVFHRGPGASCMMSGAIDRGDAFGTSAKPFSASPQEVANFVQELGLWRLDAKGVLVATAYGALREASGCDRAVLDLTLGTLRKVAIPRLFRSRWNADLLARSWTQDPWASERGVRFEAVDLGVLASTSLHELADADLAAHLDDAEYRAKACEVMRTHTEGFDAVLLGPWLGLEGNTAERAHGMLGKPIGESLSPVGSGVAGFRYERARDRLFERVGVQVHDANVTAVRLTSDGVVLDCAGKSQPVVGKCVVIACGGLVGGGLVSGASEWEECGEVPSRAKPSLTLSFKAPLGLCANGKRVESVGSLQGPNLEDYAWPATMDAPYLLMDAGVAHRDLNALDGEGQPVPNVFVAGDILSDYPHAALIAIESGLRAGARAASRDA